MSAPLLGREQILAVLRDLAEELDRLGVRAEVFLVGGAAMTLAYDTRRATRDVDAIFEPKQTVYAAARRVAENHGLPEDWLNDAVKGFLHGEDPDAVPVLDTPGLRVDVASPRYLLAMKLLAARDEDVDDILFLYRLCGFRSVDEGLDLVEAAYPGKKIRSASSICLRSTWPSVRRSSRASSKPPRYALADTVRQRRPALRGVFRHPFNRFLACHHRSSSRISRAARCDRSGGPGESHPRAPTDPGVNLSTHRAPVIRLWPL